MKMNTMSKNVLMTVAAMSLLISALGGQATAQGYSDWSAPENLGPAVNSSAFDGGHFVSNDGLYLFISSTRAGGYGSFDLYISQRPSPQSPWGTPVSLGADLNTSFAEFTPFLTDDGHFLYFSSNRPGGCGGNDFYVARRLDSTLTRWSTPENLGCVVNSIGVELSPSVVEEEDGTVYLYFSSGLRPGGLGFGDIYFSTLHSDGTFGPPSPILEFNTPFNDIRPGLRHDGLEIFFDSNRPGSMMNLQDIYTSTRPCSECHWPAPVNLGPLVNSDSIDGGPKLSSDGTELYFMSDRPGGSGDQDIYVTRRTRLDPHF